MSIKSVLIVEDNPLYLESLTMILEEEYNLHTAGTQKEAVEILFSQNAAIDLILLDLNLPDAQGSTQVSLFTGQFPEIPVIVMTMDNDPHTAADVIKRGARDYIQKQGLYDNKEYITEMIKKVIPAEEKGQTAGGSDYFFPSTPEFRELFLKAEMAVKESLALFIFGETGTGKSQLVKYLHQKVMPHSPLVEVDCGAVSPTLLESELFGHRKGAFTDARQDKKGLIQEADGGILFLDEISNATDALQQKLLRVLQEGKVKNLGANAEIPVKFTLVTAANKDLYQEVEEGNFRRDLLYRINEVEISLSPLRENRELAARFIEHFLKIYNRKCGTSFSLPTSLLGELLERPWMGNIRELEREIKRLVYFNHYGIPLEKKEENRDEKSFKELQYDKERLVIIDALKKHDGNMKKTAAYLNINRSTLYSKMERLNIEKDKI